MPETPAGIFVSYTRADSAFVDRLEADLRSYGFGTWVDRLRLEGGDDWAREIERQINQAYVVVVILSPESIASVWVRRELSFAEQAGKFIIPVLLRTISQIPIMLSEKQLIDFRADYNNAMLELRLAVLNARAAPQVLQRPAPRPIQAVESVPGPSEELVNVSPPLPAPDPDLNMVFMQGTAALARGELDRADISFRQVVAHDPAFGNGLAAEELAKLDGLLVPIQLERLHRVAGDAYERGAWGEEIGAWQAVLQRQPDDVKANERLSAAQQNQRWAWLYENARAFANSSDLIAARSTLLSLWQHAPTFRDPARIAPADMDVPKTYEEAVFLGLPPGHRFLLMRDDGAATVAWSPDAGQFATAGKTTSSYPDKGGFIHVWDSASGALSYKIDDSSYGSGYYRVAWSPDGTKLLAFASYSSSNNTLRVWELACGQLLTKDAPWNFSGDIIWSPDSALIASYDYQSAGVWQPAEGQFIFIERVYDHALIKIAWSPDSQSLYVGMVHRESSQTVVEKWGYKKGTRKDKPAVVQRSPLQTIDASYGHVVAMRSYEGGIRAALVGSKFDKQLLHLVGSNSGRTVLLWTMELDLVYKDSYRSRILETAFSNDWKRVAVLAEGGRKIQIWDTSGPRLLFTHEGFPGEVGALAWSPDGMRIASLLTSQYDKPVVEVWKC